MATGKALRKVDEVDVAPAAVTASGTYEQAEAQAVADKLDALIAALDTTYNVLIQRMTERGWIDRG